ncbi:unnamed protein product [Rotaria socialis]|uniref:Uncharacterized protein n=1 Tax=Rotaria socialis TaxID=392032 RepID=A0A818MIG8_9BILA|nr:unnamed protein product [Rotaria socialis]
MHLLVAIPFLLNLFLATSNGENPCRYADSAGVIDLTSLGHTDGTPAFADTTTSASAWKYSFNPCKPFTEGTTCKDVAVCQVPFTSGESFILAKHDSAVWIPPIGFGGSATLTYTYQTKHVKISMQCTKDTEVNVLEIISESPQETYNMKLSSKCACFDGCKSKYRASSQSKHRKISINDGFSRGKKELIVSAGDLRISDAERPKHGTKSIPGVDWESVVRMITELIRKNMKTDLASLITKPFLTTKPVEQAVFNCALMDATKPYYSYGVTLLCGIPEVTLRGSQGDFQQIIDSIN